MEALIPHEYDEVERDGHMAALYLINLWASEDPGSLVSRKVVIDRLLDIRNLLSQEDVGLVDRILEDVPGVTVVEGSWWLDELGRLESRLSHSER